MKKLNEKETIILTELIEWIKNKIDESLKKGEIKKVDINQNYFRWKIEKFEYSLDSGVSSSSRGEYTTKIQSMYPYTFDLTSNNEKEFNFYVDELKNIYQDQNIQIKLHQFLRVVTQNYLEEKQIKQELIELFLKELNDEPLKVIAIVRLQGITLEEDSIKLSNVHTLRRIKPSDLEIEIPVYSPFEKNNLLETNNTAILEIEKEVLSPIDIQKEIELSILLLKLFKVGRTRITSYSLFCKTITRFISGTFTPVTSLIFARENSKIYKTDNEKIRIFWKEFNKLDYKNNLRNNNFSDLENVNFAYQRYDETLFSSGSYEQQIANTIIGLESLFLNNSEDISKFLRLRISKFFGLIGLNPEKVQEVLKDAYEVRSCFVHGNKMSYNKRKKIQRKYETEQELLNKILEYLRLSIIIIFVINKPKEEFIDLIDNSFINKKKEDELSNLLKEIMKKFALD